MSVADFVKNGRKVVAVGRNYIDHCAELKNPVPTKPMLFMKPVSAYLPMNSGPIIIPHYCKNFHYEVELGIVVGETISHTPESEVMSRVAGYALALDMTARDVQEQCKKEGIPWEPAKCFDKSLPISRFISPEELANPQNVDIWLKVNGVTQQQANTRDMIFKIPYLLSYISSMFTLEPGDLVITGTPAGVGPVVDGDKITCGLGDILSCEWDVQKHH